MSSFQQYQQTFAQLLTKAGSKPSTQTATPTAGGGTEPAWAPLINALPYFNDNDFETSLRATICNPITVYTTNDPVAVIADYGYDDDTPPYYRSAFFGDSVNLSDAANHMIQQLQPVMPGMGPQLWQNFSTVLLNDAARQQAGVTLDSQKLNNDLAQVNALLTPVLSNIYLSIYKTSYAPTMNALKAVSGNDEAAMDLAKAIMDQEFTANINQAIAVGGDSTSAATWFLFNLWITLKALDMADVDGTIKTAQAKGLTVPAQIAPQSWWHGGYTTWFMPLNGADVTGFGGVTSSMQVYNYHVTVITLDPNSPTGLDSSFEIDQLQYGFLKSFCLWYGKAAYIPADTSCFGKGTGVLMADGSVKPVEQVCAGDMVMSTNGACAVALVESPKRNGRVLYQINNSNVFATAAHPFRAAASEEVKRVAIDPWALKDGFPTMIKDGVGALNEHVSLSGRKGNEAAGIAVTQITESMSSMENSEDLVYDLVLDNWAKNGSVYFVGGPDVFFAVDAETIDPLHSASCTRAILAAMKMALPACRQAITDPAKEIPLMLMMINKDEIIKDAIAGKEKVDKALLQSVSTESMFTKNGEWDAVASQLEYQLGRQWARWLRRETGKGIRSIPTGGNRYTLTVHDIELTGQSPIPANTAAEIKLMMQGDMEKTISIPAHDHNAWHIILDETIDLGEQVAGLAINGYIKTGAQTFAKFHMPVRPSKSGSAEYALFDANNRVTGRIAVAQRYLTAEQIEVEKRSAENYSDSDAAEWATRLGYTAGKKIAAYCHAKIESKKTKEQQGK